MGPDRSGSEDQHTRTEPRLVRTNQGYSYARFLQHQGGNEVGQTGFQLASVFPQYVLDAASVVGEQLSILGDQASELCLGMDEQGAPLGTIPVVKPSTLQASTKAKMSAMDRWHRSLTDTMPNSILTVGYSMSRLIPMNDDLPHSYQELQRALGQIGYFRRGTPLKRFMACGKRGCACHRLLLLSSTVPTTSGPVRSAAKL